MEPCLMISFMISVVPPKHSSIYRAAEPSVLRSVLWVTAAYRCTRRHESPVAGYQGS
jgi:hypothetical protein